MANLSSATASNLTSSPSSHRISFLHYHKTGRDLSHVLARGVSSALAMYLTKAHHQPKRERFDSELSCSGRDEVQVWTAPELFQRVAPLPSSNIVVHMVRDPASWAVSAYDYHRQNPTPEAWRPPPPPPPHPHPPPSLTAQPTTLSLAVALTRRASGQALYLATSRYICLHLPGAQADGRAPDAPPRRADARRLLRLRLRDREVVPLGRIRVRT